MATNREQTVAERRRKVLRLYEQGLTQRVIAERLDCHWHTVRLDLRAGGVPPSSTNKPTTEPRICAREGCDNMFRPTPGQVQKGFGKFCSRECDHEAHRIYPRPEERQCERCGTPFTPIGSNVAMGWGRFCSKRCSALSTGAHERKKGREVTCQHCGRTKWRYDSMVGAGFCSLECSNAYRWKHGIGISDDVVSLASGPARQRWKGRWNGRHGGLDGREGGRPPKATSAQAAKVWRLHGEGRSTREIAAEVFGDARFKDRVARIVRR
jgi:hypothetical protein